MNFVGEEEFGKCGNILHPPCTEAWSSREEAWCLACRNRAVIERLFLGPLRAKLAAAEKERDQYIVDHRDVLLSMKAERDTARAQLARIVDFVTQHGFATKDEVEALIADRGETLDRQVTK